MKIRGTCLTCGSTWEHGRSVKECDCPVEPGSIKEEEVNGND